MSLSVSRLTKPRVVYGIASSLFVVLVTLGIFAANGWLPRTDPLSGKRTGWFGTEIAKNAPNTWNPFAQPLPNPTPQLSKEYIYAGSRLLAVEDANAGASPTPTPAPTPYGLEGDVAVRVNGDGDVLSNDVTIERDFAAGLITPQPGTNELQRADTAPAGTLGDCEIAANDVIQVRRYASGLDPLTPAGGPESCGNRSQNDGESAGRPVTESNPSNRGLRVGPAINGLGQTITVPVLMNMAGNEVAALFTLEYDAAKLSNPRVLKGNLLPTTAVLTTNTTQAGKIGILVDADVPLSSIPTELPIILVTFDVTNGLLALAVPINITSSLAIQSVSDSNANLLTTSYSNAIVATTN